MQFGLHYTDRNIKLYIYIFIYIFINIYIYIPECNVMKLIKPIKHTHLL